MRHELTTTVDIAAEPAEVWRHLTDLDRFSDWNPFFTHATGKVEVGAKLSIRAEPPGGRSITVRPTVTVVEPHSRLEWLGRLGAPGLFDARHRFDLTPLDHGTRLVHSESFRGLLVPFLRKSLDRSTKRGFDEMNAALAARAGAGPASQG